MLDRPDVLRRIDAAFPDQPVVLTLGGTIREMLAVVGRKPNHLYSLDAMGQPLAIGLGLALGLGGGSSTAPATPGPAGAASAAAAEARRVVVVEGDGSVLMGFSALATVGHLKPRNLVLLVLDNGVYLATGGQPTAAASTDLAAVARACGWAAARDLGPDEDLDDALRWAAATDGPLLLRVPVGTAQPRTGFFLEDPVLLGRAFQDWLGTTPR